MVREELDLMSENADYLALRSSVAARKRLLLIEETGWGRIRWSLLSVCIIG